MADSWGSASTEARARAARRWAAVERLRGLLRAGAALEDAVRTAAAEADASPGAVRRWHARAGEAGGPEDLVDRPRTGRPSTVWTDDADEAYAIWRKDYLRVERPGAAACWRRVRNLAQARGWTIPSSAAFVRRLRAEVAPAVVVRAREGRIAAIATAPFQQRSTAELRPLDVVNGDGWTLRTFVVCPDTGRAIRPVLWAWQDVRTRRLLGWRIAATESAEVVRLSMADVCRTHGVPRKVVVDNTYAASSRYLFGPSRFRRRGAKPPPEEAVLGVFSSVGIEAVGRTGVDRDGEGRGVGKGRSKPVERSFQDLAESIGRHPRLAGCFTGPNTLDKPENHGKRAAPWAAVLEVAAEAVAEYNARPGRRMEGVRGISCDEAWRREIEGVPVRRLTREQAGLLLLAAESTRIGKDGAFSLAAGGAPGVPRNRYAAEEEAAAAALLARRGQRVVARFDPADLHGPVEVYDLSGRWLLTAECVLPVGFSDHVAARTHARLQRRRQRRLDEAAGALSDAGALEAAYAGPGRAAGPEPEPLRKVVGMTPAAVETPAAGRRRQLEDRISRGLRRLHGN